MCFPWRLNRRGYNRSKVAISVTPMTRIFIPTLALVFVSSVSAQAYEPSAEVKADVVQSLAEIGCTSDDIEVEGNGYKANDAKCGDGRYDITLDKDFMIVRKEKEHD